MSLRYNLLVKVADKFEAGTDKKVYAKIVNADKTMCGYESLIDHRGSIKRMFTNNLKRGSEVNYNKILKYDEQCKDFGDDNCVDIQIKGWVNDALLIERIEVSREKVRENGITIASAVYYIIKNLDEKILKQKQPRLRFCPGDVVTPFTTVY